jgi:hypothetical protein
LLEESVLRRVKGDLELTGMKRINGMTEGIKIWNSCTHEENR